MVKPTRVFGVSESWMETSPNTRRTGAIEDSDASNERIIDIPKGLKELDVLLCCRGD